MAITDQLVSGWKLDESSGNALDVVGSNTLTDNNSVGTASGVINTARSFSQASQQFFSLASNSDLSIADATVSYEWTCWAQITDTTNSKQLITKRTNQNVGSNLEYMLRVDGQTPVVYWGTSGFGSVSSGATLSASTWYFLTFGFDASVSKFFVTVNAGAQTLGSFESGQVLAGTNAFGLGGNPVSAANECHDGLLDEVFFWKGRTLTGAERTTLYNGGAGLAYPFGASDILLPQICI